jgi:hypothetical protein
LKVVFREKKQAESSRNENRRLTDTAPNWIEEMKQAHRNLNELGYIDKIGVFKLQISSSDILVRVYCRLQIKKKLYKVLFNNNTFTQPKLWAFINVCEVRCPMQISSKKYKRSIIRYG